MRLPNKYVYAALAVFLIVFWTGFIWLGMRLAPKEKVFDCSMVSFHPDIPKDVKQKCREVK